MTEVRLLYGNEIQWAVNVAREAFVAGMSLNIRSKEEIDRFYAQITPEKIWQEGNARTLFPWGAFWNGQLCAVGTLQKEGMITMLYVHPDYQKKGMGTLLLNAMRDYAVAVLHLNKVTIEVSPVTLAPYFYKRGFVVAPQEMDIPGRVLLECKLSMGIQSVQPQAKIPQPMIQQPMVQPQQAIPQEISYKKKPVGAKVILIAMAVVFVIATAISSGITLYHLTKEARYTIEDYYNIVEENEL